MLGFFSVTWLLNLAQKASKVIIDVWLKKNDNLVFHHTLTLSPLTTIKAKNNKIMYA